MKNAVKKARTAVAEGAANKAELVKEAVRVVQSTASKNVIRDQTASRTVSRLMSLH